MKNSGLKIETNTFWYTKLLLVAIGITKSKNLYSLFKDVKIFKFIVGGKITYMKLKELKESVFPKVKPFEELKKGIFN